MLGFWYLSLVAEIRAPYLRLSFLLNLMADGESAMRERKPQVRGSEFCHQEREREREREREMKKPLRCCYCRIFAALWMRSRDFSIWLAMNMIC